MNARTWLLAAAAAVAAIGLGCSAAPRIPIATAIEMTNSGIDPAAEGKIRISRDGNDNVSVLVQVEHLAPPAEVAAGATTYVLWIRPAGQALAQNAGRLEVRRDLRGSVLATTAYTTFDVFITPEESATATAPTHRPVLFVTIRA